MGCWNQTCGLTQLHIRAGQKVMVVPVAQSYRDSLCYSTPFYTPFPVPFYASYDDYGGGDASHGIGLRLAMDEIRENLIEVEQGENEYHDIAVKRENFDEDLFWRAVHKNRLKIKSPFSGKPELEVGFVMIHMDVFNHIAENYEFSAYDYDRKTGQSVYFNYKLQDILNAVPEFVDKLLEPNESVEEILAHLKTKEMSDEERTNAYRRIHRLFNSISSVAHDLKHHENGEKRTNAEGFNRAAAWLEHYDSHMAYGGFSANRMEQYAVPLIESRNREQLIELLSEYIRLLFVDVIMLHTRKFWSPQAGAGSQQQEPDGYLAINAAIAHVLAEEKRYWEEDEEEDDEDGEEKDEGD